MQLILMMGVVLLAAFTQGLAGFALALISMPLLASLLGLRIAAPLVAVVALTVEVLMLIHYRETLNVRAVARFSLASLFGIPLGVWGLKTLSEEVVLTALGVVIISYALYSLFNLRLPPIEDNGWAYGFGFVAGILSGAYNTPGPPIVMYGTGRGWQPAEFKSNLQAYFALNSLVVIGTHIASQSYTPLIGGYFLLTLPALTVGLWLGIAMDRFIAPQAFRRMVLALLLVLGLMLVV